MKARLGVTPDHCFGRDGCGLGSGRAQSSADLIGKGTEQVIIPPHARTRPLKLGRVLVVEDVLILPGRSEASLLRTSRSYAILPKCGGLSLGANELAFNLRSAFDADSVVVHIRMHLRH